VKQGIQRATQTVAGRTSKHAVQRTMGRSIESAVDGTTTRMAAKGMRRSTTIAAGHFAPRMTSHAVEAVVERAAEQVATKSSSRAFRHTIESGAEKVGFGRIVKGTARGLRAKLGRRILTLIPLLGGLSAFQGCIQDRNRCRLEYDKTPESTTGVYFGIATLCGAVDILAHFYIAIALMTGWGHEKLTAAEHLSFWVAVVSILLAVLGELASKSSEQQNLEA